MTNDDQDLNKIPNKIIQNILAILTNFGVGPTKYWTISRRRLLQLAMQFLFPKEAVRNKWIRRLTKDHSTVFTAKYISGMLLTKQDRYIRRQKQHELRDGTYEKILNI